MADRHHIADVADLETPGSRVIEEVDGLEIAVFNVDGEYYAVANHCPHQSGPLCEGRLTEAVTTDEDDWMLTWDGDERVIRCPWHNWQFDVRTGEHLDTSSYRVPTFDVEVEDGRVYVVR